MVWLIFWNKCLKKKFHLNFIVIVVSEASTNEYQEYLPAKVHEAGII